MDMVMESSHIRLFGFFSFFTLLFFLLFLVSVMSDAKTTWLLTRRNGGKHTVKYT